MPSYIIKPKRDEDFYVVYSTIVDAPTEWGKRSEIFAKKERFDRADDSGTSALWGNPPFLGWHDDELQVREGFNTDETPKTAWAAYVARDNLRAFCESIREDGTWDARSPLITRWSTMDGEAV